MEPSKAEKATELNLHNTVRLTAEGWAKVLGDLEARVMRVVWAIGAPSTAREVHERVIEEHDVALARGGSNIDRGKQQDDRCPKPNSMHLPNVSRLTRPNLPGIAGET